MNSSTRTHQKASRKSSSDSGESAHCFHAAFARGACSTWCQNSQRVYIVCQDWHKALQLLAPGTLLAKRAGRGKSPRLMSLVRRTAQLLKKVSEGVSRASGEKSVLLRERDASARLGGAPRNRIPEGVKGGRCSRLGGSFQSSKRNISNVSALKRASCRKRVKDVSTLKPSLRDGCAVTIRVVMRTGKVRMRLISAHRLCFV